ncbi:MAG: TetR/AcrR family transcriptional regulator [Bacteroidales bacterium]|jgi:AcrR family transcriptional regulator|nr:TetR/AcrR family transcriptional regulator [Bacteroidales bacterium]
MTLEERIIEKARHLFYSYGAKSVTMDEVASQLGISKRTLYTIYASKDDLLRGVLQDEYEKLKDNIALESEHGKNNGMRMLIKLMSYSKQLAENISERFFEELEKFHPDLFYEYWTKFKKECDGRIVNFMNEAQKKGYIRQEVNIELAHAILDVVMKSNHELLKSGKYTKEDIKNSGTKPFIRGIFTVEGQQILNKLGKELNL